MKRKNLGFYIFLGIALITIIVSCCILLLPDKEPTTIKLTSTPLTVSEDAQSLYSQIANIPAPTITFEIEDGSTITCEKSYARLYGMYKSVTDFTTEYPECTEDDWNQFRLALTNALHPYISPSDEFTRVSSIAQSWYNVPPSHLPPNAFYSFAFQVPLTEWEEMVKDFRHTDEVAADEMALQATVNIRGTQYPSVILMNVQHETVICSVYVGGGFIPAFNPEEVLIYIHHPSSTQVIAHTYLTMQHLPSDDELYYQLIIGE